MFRLHSKYIIVALFLLNSLNLIYAGEQQDKILDQIEYLIVADEFTKAKDLYETNRDILRDNGYYEASSLFMYFHILRTEGHLDEAYEVIIKEINIIAANIDSANFALSGENLTYPYFCKAFLGISLGKSDIKESLEDAKHAYERENIRNHDYEMICNALNDYIFLSKKKEIDNLVKIAFQHSKTGNYDVAISVIDDGIKLLENLPDINDKDKLQLRLRYLQGYFAWEKKDYTYSEVRFDNIYSYIKNVKDISEFEDIFLHVCNRLGSLYAELKNFSLSRKFYQEALSYYEVINKFNDDYAENLIGLAAITKSPEEISKSAELLVKAIGILQSNESLNCEILLNAYSILIAAYMQMNEFDNAVSTVVKAQRIVENYNIKTGLSAFYNNVGISYLKYSQLERAKEYFEKALRSVSKFDNSDVCKINLCRTQFLLNNKGVANHAYRYSEYLKRDALSKFIVLGEDQRLEYWENTVTFLNWYNFFLLRHKSKKRNGFLYDNTLFSKGLLLRMSNYMTNEICNSITSDNQYKLQTIADYKNLMALGCLSADSVAYYQVLVMKLEKELMRDNLKYDALTKTFLISWKDVKKNLHKGEAAIEFIKLPILSENNFSGENEYAALILTPSSKYPELVTICHEDSLTKLLAMPDALMRFNNETARNEHYRAYLYGNGVYSYKMGTRRAKIQTVGQTLYNLLWSRIEEKLNGVNRVYFSPIGVLNAISFSALTNDSLPLSEKYDMRLVSSTYEVAVPDNDDGRINNSVLYGGIEYDADESALVSESRSYQRGNLIASRGLDLSSTERSGWGYLEGTLVESRMIQHKLDSVGVAAKLITGVPANEESFKALSGNSPRLLHIATHGFFLSDPRDIQTNEFLNTSAVNLPQNQQTMLRSGLLFAGANRSWTGNDVIDGIEDGILTAEEISRLNLSGTEIAVLSACETGLGEDMASEGVFGLQRAFKLAGVNTLVMSLWKVPDEATSSLMQLFYDNWLSGMGKHEAFRKAQFQIKQQYPNPYNWAGFVMLD